MTDDPLPPEPRPDLPPDVPPGPALPPGPSLLRLAATGIVVLLLIAGGVMTGARLWPKVTTVERRVVAPVSTAREPSPAEQLPDLVDDACPGIVRLTTTAPPAPPPAPAPAPSAAGRHHRGHRRHAASAVPPAPPPAAPLPLGGVLVSADGYLVTSAERLDAAPGPVTAELSDGRRLPAALVASDPLTGLALMKVNAGGLPFLEWGDPAVARAGTWGFAVASPAGAGCVARVGIVAGDSLADGAPRRSFVRVAAYPGPDAEGTPFLGEDGRMLGIAAFASAGDADAGNLLLPAGIAAQVTDAMIRNGKPPPSPFGLFAADLDPALAARLGAARLRGAAILLVAPGSPADRAGLRAGDVVVSAGDTPVSGATELARALDPEADAIPLDVARGGEQLSLTLKP